MKRIAILGCGPAGLLAAHAAHIMRVPFTIYSRPVKSVMGGAQFLHEPIPQLTDPYPDAKITVQKSGTREGYATKIYGSPDAPCSFDLLQEGEHPAWSLRHAYDLLWGMYSDEIVVNTHIDAVAATGLLRDGGYDAIFSSIPAPALCYRNHTFDSVPVHFSPMHSDTDNWITYDGNYSVGWYRASVVFGEGWIEWPGHASTLAPINGNKPLSTDCDCLKGITRIGRFGQWKKGVLTHHAFQEVANALQQL